MAQDGKKLKPPIIGAFRYGTMTGAEFAPSKNYAHPDVKLVGNWEGEGLGYWYANWKAVIALAKAGLLQQLPGDGKKFQAITGYRFCIWRVQGEGDAHHDWFAIAYDAGGKQLALTAFAEPVEPATQDAGPPAQAPPEQASGPLVPPTAGQPGAPVAPPVQQEGPASGNPPPPNHSTAEQRAEDKAKRERQTLAKVDALYALALVVAAYQQVRFFNVPSMDLDDEVLQAGAATVMISLEKNGYDPATDRRPAYLKRLRRLEHQSFPDDKRCPDPDAKPAEEEKPKRRSRAKPKDEPLPTGPTAADLKATSEAASKKDEPAPVSTVPGSTFAGTPAGLEDEDEDDDLPF